jgi:hypothetical protein
MYSPINQRKVMSPQAGWILNDQVVPRLRSAIPHTVNYVGCEDSEELIQDATAMAARLMHNVEEAGKKVTPGNIAYYTIQHIKSGRRSTGSSVADVLATGTQLTGRARLNSLEEVVATDQETGGEIFLLHDVLSNDQEDPSTRAARKMDWESFCSQLSEREQAVVVFIAEGKTLREAAQAFGLCDSTMQGTKRALAAAVVEFMGADILAEIKRRPQWQDDLDSIQESIACRTERRR